MKILNLTQGSPEWLAARSRYCTASEASAMMGASKKVRRNELLAMKATGSEREFSDWAQRNLLDRGHAIEASARAIAEGIIGEDLFPCTGVSDDDTLLASFDGLTMLGDVAWECKSWNEAKAQDVRDGRVPEEDRWQVVQQLVVSGADRALYMVTDGTPERTVHVWAALDPADEKRLRDGWRQFNEDVKTYRPEAKAQAAGRAPEVLPALFIQVSGAVTASNLAEFKQSALAVFGGIKTDLQDDQDFADAEQTVKWCQEVEDRIAAAKEHALGQTQSIDELFRTMDEVAAEARSKRLELDKLVKSRKEAVKVERRQKAEKALADHIEGINRRLGTVRLPAIQANFVGAMKNKRTLASLQDALDTELARAKIEASARGGAMADSLAKLNELSAGFEFLFRDMQALVEKDAETVELIAKDRIVAHKKQEADRLEAERERIRREEQARADREAREKLAADQRQDQEQAAPAEVQSQPNPAGRVQAAGGRPSGGSVGGTRWGARVVDLPAFLRAVANDNTLHHLVTVDLEAVRALGQTKAVSIPGVAVGNESAGG